MNILWITFTMFPEALQLSGGIKVHKGSGGWLFNYADALLDYNSDINLRVAIVNNMISKFEIIKGSRITYYLIPPGKGIDFYHHDYDKYWRDITKEYKPDIVHIHGLETSLALSYIKACGNKNVVISIQGLPNIIARYLLHGTSKKEIVKHITIRDILRCKTYLGIIKGSRKKEGLIKETMLNSQNFIGRTEWDKSHLWAINPSASYFFCNETMRKGFYNQKWEYDNCNPHTIFVSALKGIHNLIKALPFVLREYPDVSVKVATGGNLYQADYKKRMMMTGYENYIRCLIKELRLESVIHFLGPLTESQMIDNYIKANVFVSPSSCENSSNSVCEAQLIGIPLVASYVGGMHDLIPNDKCGRLYRCEEHEMLAKIICELFESSKSFDNSFMRDIANKRHNPITNVERTINIYNEIISRE